MKILFMVCVLAVLSLQAYAHPPSEIVVAPAKDGALEITVMHSGSGDHFIKNVTITKGDAEIYNKNFTAQTDGTKLYLPQVKIDAKKGEEIKVTATCSKYGSKTVTYKISAK